MGKIARHIDPHLFAIITLGECDKGQQDFFAEEDNGDDCQDSCCLGPGEVCAKKGVDGVDGFVKDDGVDLLHQRANQSEDKGYHHKGSIGSDKGCNIFEKS